MSKEQKQRKVRFIQGGRNPMYGHINDMLDAGWIIKKVIAQKVSVTNHEGYGGFLVYLEKSV